MDQIVDIPVKDPNGKLIGTARIEKVDDGYIAQINIDRERGQTMIRAMTEGVVTGLSVGTEITPVMKTSHFFQGRAEYGRGPARVSLPSMIGSEEIDLRFGFHKASIEGPNATAPIHELLRSDFKFFAHRLDHHLPAGREKDVAMERLEDTSMWSHKSIARISARTER